VSVPTQAAMVTRAYQVWASYSWAGPLFMYSGRDQGNDASSTDDWFGMINYNYTAKPAFDATVHGIGLIHVAPVSTSGVPVDNRPQAGIDDVGAVPEGGSMS